jgi:hypothetical protein
MRKQFPITSWYEAACIFLLKRLITLNDPTLWNAVLSRSETQTHNMFLQFLTPLSVTGWVGISSMYVVSCSPNHLHDVSPRTPKAGINLTTLAPDLSPTAKIYLPGSSDFAASTVRWSNLEPPTANVVIAPGTEEDVAKIVCFFVCKYLTFL